MSTTILAVLGVTTLLLYLVRRRARLRAEDGDAIILLPGWRDSKGAKAELAVAQWLGLRVMVLVGNDVVEWGSYVVERGNYV